MKSIRPYQVAVLLALLSSITLPVNAQDICSPEGKSRMRGNNVSEIQITKICSAATGQPVSTAATGQPVSTAVDYKDLQSVFFDMRNAKGKTVQFNGRFNSLTTDNNSPAMYFIADTGSGLDAWDVSFGSDFNRTFSELSRDQRLSIICRITAVHSFVSRCDLIKLSYP